MIMDSARLFRAFAVVATLAACGRSGAPKPTGEVTHEGRPGPVGLSKPTGEVTGAAGPSSPSPAKPTDDGTYQGRPIAQTCSYLGAGWLDRPERSLREQPDRVLDALALDPHSTVA